MKKAILFFSCVLYTPFLLAQTDKKEQLANYIKQLQKNYTTGNVIDSLDFTCKQRFLPLVQKIEAYAKLKVNNISFDSAWANGAYVNATDANNARLITQLFTQKDSALMNTLFKKYKDRFD